MNENPKKRVIRRIAIALADEGADNSALAAAAQLAASMQSELAGLFVEDINLLRLAGLPFAREFSHFTNIERRLETSEIERQLKAQATAAQRALALAAEQAGVPWSFRVARGLMGAALLEIALEADVIALGATRRELVQHTALWALAEGIAGRSWRPVSRVVASPVVAVLKPSAEASRILQVAANQAAAAQRPLTVFIAADTPEGFTQLREQAVGQLGDRPAQFHRLSRAGLTEMLAAVRAESPWLLVLAADETVLEQSAIQALCEQLNCPALLVR